MATRGRPSSPDGPVSNSERKRQFDKRMRNAHGEVPGEPMRKPVVVYLSDKAREVLRRHRDESLLAGMSPLLDSKLIERQLLEYETHRRVVSRDHSGAVDSELSSTSPPRAADEEVALVRRLRSVIRRYEVEWSFLNSGLISPRRWAFIEQQLLDANRATKSHHVHQLAVRLTDALPILATEVERTQLLSHELGDYLRVLIDLVLQNEPVMKIGAGDFSEQ